MKRMREEVMRRLRYKEIYTFFLLFILTAVFVSLFVVRLGVFGSKVDWISQHSVLPDYFRRQFYDQGPSFSLSVHLPFLNPLRFAAPEFFPSPALR